MDQEDILFASYFTNEVMLNSCWTATAGFGFGEAAPPTLIEAHSDGLFLGVAQSGYTGASGHNHTGQRDGLPSGPWLAG